MKFKTEDIISSATGILVGSIDGIYKVLSYMTSENLFTHQLPAAMDTVKDEMFKQCPWLNDVDIEHVTTENVEAWIKEELQKHDEEYELTPVPELWGTHDPIDDMAKLLGKDQEMIVVEV